MNILGIIAEYNPLHNGHIYQMKECARRAQADYTVVIMSGNFTQRGEAAVLDKWTRSRLAVENGADLVIELPFVYAVNSAEHFARGGVRILEAMGITHLGFGAETEDIASMEKIAALSVKEDAGFTEAMKEALDQGVSYAKARETAVSACLGEEAAQLVKTPNNILALEYLKQINLLGGKIKPVMIQRKGAGYHDLSLDADFASASAIRKGLDKPETSKYVPENVAEALKDAGEKDLFPFICSRILSMSKEELAKISAVGEGLENRLKDNIRTSRSLDEYVDNVISKRYPETRIRRILVQCLMNMGEFEDHYYGRLLAAGNRGTELLKKIKKTTDFNIITNINKEEQLPENIKYDILAGDMYNLVSGEDLYKKSDYVVHPFIQKG